jgi:hypothetical protein
MFIYLLKEEEEVGEPHGSADVVEDVSRTVTKDLQPGQLIPHHLAKNFCKWVFFNKSCFYDFILTTCSMTRSADCPPSWIQFCKWVFSNKRRFYDFIFKSIIMIYLKCYQKSIPILIFGKKLY